MRVDYFDILPCSHCKRKWVDIYDRREGITVFCHYCGTERPEFEHRTYGAKPQAVSWAKDMGFKEEWLWKNAHIFLRKP